MTRTAAFFDLDRTLIDINSGLLWARYEHQSGNITRLQMLKAGLWTLLYHLSLIDMESAYASAVAHYSGQAEAEMDARTRAWFHEHVAPRLRPGAPRAIKEHREAGHKLVMLTSSSWYQGLVASETWGFDACLANRFSADAEGRLTGEVHQPLCYGPGKVHHAERWAAEHDVDLDGSYFYSDSYSDLPMLERVGNPRIVAPDPRLRRVAKRRGWPVLEW